MASVCQLDAGCTMGKAHALALGIASRVCASGAVYTTSTARACASACACLWDAVCPWGRLYWSAAACR